MDGSPKTRDVSPLWRWLPVIAWAGVIFAASSVPGTSIPGGYSVYGHLGEYFVLGALAMRAVRSEDRAAVLLAIALCALYGASDELHQAFVPFRTPDPLDWLTDLVGASVGVGGYLLLRMRRRAGRAPRQ
jgi:hypothetical protein